jgi:hypothetical protein
VTDVADVSDVLFDPWRNVQQFSELFGAFEIAIDIAGITNGLLRTRARSSATA